MAFNEVELRPFINGYHSLQPEVDMYLRGLSVLEKHQHGQKVDGPCRRDANAEQLLYSVSRQIARG
jgi:hypothetical protein